MLKRVQATRTTATETETERECLIEVNAVVRAFKKDEEDKEERKEI